METPACRVILGTTMSKLSPAALRPLFPAISRAAYLNAAAASPLARPVAEAIAAHHREMVEFGDVHFDAWLQRREEIRVSCARFVGCHPLEVAFVGSTSLGFHLVGE